MKPESGAEQNSLGSYPSWARDELSRAYFHAEWQKVPRTQRALFEHLCLLVFQSGLWWSLIVAKRQELNSALYGFEPTRLSSMSEDEIAAYIAGESGIRNQEKLRACVNNARVLIDSQVDLPELFLEQFPEDMVVSDIEDLPRTTQQTDKIASYLSSVGFKRIGPVIACSLAQAAGYIRLAN